MYREKTHDVQVEVVPEFIPGESSPEERQFVFAYRVSITNQGTVPTQLLSRHWIITDGHGKVREVEGSGVIGEQPRLEPGQTFTYSSFCPLTTPTGNMRGTYQMKDDRGRTYDVRIPLFFLRDLSILH